MLPCKDYNYTVYNAYPEKHTFLLSLTYTLANFVIVANTSAKYCFAIVAKVLKFVLHFPKLIRILRRCEGLARA